MGNVIDVMAETGGDELARMRQQAMKAAETPAHKAPSPERKRIAREITFPMSLCDPWTGEVQKSYRVTSRVPDGPEQARIVRFATSLAGVPMDTLAGDDRAWFRALARCEIQIRDVVGGGLSPTAKPEERVAAFMALLWEDGDVLGGVHRRLVEHEARFREGDPREGQSEARSPRVVVPPLESPDVVSGPA